MDIKVIHTAIDTDMSKSVKTLYSGQLTPRRLAKAVAVYDKDREYYYKLFGPGVIYPKHTITVWVNGQCLHPVDVARLNYEHEIGRTWTYLAEGLMKWCAK